MRENHERRKKSCRILQWYGGWDPWLATEHLKPWDLFRHECIRTFTQTCNHLLLYPSRTLSPLEHEVLSEMSYMYENFPWFFGGFAKPDKHSIRKCVYFLPYGNLMVSSQYRTLINAYGSPIYLSRFFGAPSAGGDDEESFRRLESAEASFRRKSGGIAWMVIANSMCKGIASYESYPNPAQTHS